MHPPEVSGGQWMNTDNDPCLKPQLNNRRTFPLGDKLERK